MRTRKKGLLKEQWVSICSIHRDYFRKCHLCNSGHWQNVLGMKFSSLVNKISPRFWIWWVNKF